LGGIAPVRCVGPFGVDASECATVDVEWFGVVAYEVYEGVWEGCGVWVRGRVGLGRGGGCGGVLRGVGGGVLRGVGGGVCKFEGDVRGGGVCKFEGDVRGGGVCKFEGDVAVPVE